VTIHPAAAAQMAENKNRASRSRKARDKTELDNAVSDLQAFDLLHTMYKRGSQYRNGYVIDPGGFDTEGSSVPIRVLEVTSGGLGYNLGGADATMTVPCPECGQMINGGWDTGTFRVPRTEIRWVVPSSQRAQRDTIAKQLAKVLAARTKVDDRFWQVHQWVGQLRHPRTEGSACQVGDAL
jgi:hypothetical protein